MTRASSSKPDWRRDGGSPFSPFLSRRAALAGVLTACAWPSLDAFAKGDGTEFFRSIPKSMWVWNTRPEQFGALRSFATEWRITRLLLSTSTQLLDRIETRDARPLEDLEALRHSGTTVMALAGDPAWVMQDNFPPLLARLGKFVPQVFDGIDLDVEPNALKEWRGGQRDSLLVGLAALIDLARARLDGVPLGAALNPIYARMPLGKADANAMEILAHKLDSVALMAYRDRADALVKWAEPSAAILAKAGVAWRSGVLVHDSKEKGTTFSGMSRPDFISEMARLHRTLSAQFSDSYRGLIFEDYNGLRAILGG